MDIRTLPDIAMGVRDVPDRLLVEARMVLLDTIACAFDAVSRSALRRPSGTAEDPVVWGTGSSATASDAVFCNAYHSHAADWDSVHYVTAGHPGVVILPSLMAEYETGRIAAVDVLRSYTVGVEAMAVLGNAYGDALRARRVHPTPTLGAAAAVIALCHAHRLRPSAVRMALHLVGTTVAGSTSAFGSAAKPYQVGAAARAAYEAVRFAEFSRAEPEDDWYAPLLQPLGEPSYDSPHSFAEPWASDSYPVLIKPFPACASFVQVIHQLRELFAEGRHPGIEAVAVKIDVPQTVLDASRYPLPVTVDQARFSLPFLVACLLAYGTVESRHFTETELNTSRIQELMRGVTLGLLPGRLEKFGDHLYGRMLVKHPGGALTGQVVHGVDPHVNRWQDVKQKVHTCLPGDEVLADSLIRIISAFGEGGVPQRRKTLKDLVSGSART
ncbi:MmgE/PrpD family protein [Streptomyces sp. NBC_01288]|uniref:MmgE/PrpD family protein n=1 Tax=Streptomyces sp. NBC_01288 TaxID=2903814 RepID=UPI002E0EA861|nr:MmgE/PrpD family protein [Streptomyces sp. NBC_01288]